MTAKNAFSILHATNDLREVSWAGSLEPFDRGFGKGFEDGTLEYVIDDKLYTLPASPSREAINGVAAIGKSTLAVSTRADIAFYEFETATKFTKSTYAGGSHGVVATQSGYFIAPLGNKGLLIVEPERGPEQRMRFTTGTEGILYFYRMAALHNDSGEELLIFANRKEGVGTAKFHGNVTLDSIDNRAFDGLDVIDVCGIETGTFGAIAISAYKQVILLEDASNLDRAVTLQIEGIEGNIYRVLSANGHLFVLSNTGLYLFPNFVMEHLHGAPALRIVPIMFPISAIDMNMIGNEYLLVLLSNNNLLNIDLNKHQGNYQDVSLSTKSTVFEPKWRKREEAIRSNDMESKRRKYEEEISPIGTAS